jgi:hypothetical protein
VVTGISDLLFYGDGGPRVLRFLVTFSTIFSAGNDTKIPWNVETATISTINWPIVVYNVWDARLFGESPSFPVEFFCLG